MTLNDLTPSFKVTPFFDAEYPRNGTTYRHIIEILIGTYTRPTQQRHFEWPWVILSDLAKYSMTRGVARSLCDSWASCLRYGVGLYNIELTAVLTTVTTINPLTGTLKLQTNGPLYSNTVFGSVRWRVGCYIWYSEEGRGRAAVPPSPLLAVPNVTAHPSTASVPTPYYSIWRYNYQCCCCIN